MNMICIKMGRGKGGSVPFALRQNHRNWLFAGLIKDPAPQQNSKGMPQMINGLYPDPLKLHRGALLASIVHAVMNARFPDLSHEQSWDGMNYSVQDSSGSRGTITFYGQEVVGAFFDNHNPPAQNAKLESILHEMPDTLRQVTDQGTFQYLLQDVNGRKVPVITACFWTDGGRLTGAVPWNDIVKHGAHLIEAQLLEEDQSWKRWEQNYGMNPDELRCAKALFERRIASPSGGSVPLLGEEKSFFLRNAVSPEALNEVRASLGEIGICCP